MNCIEDAINRKALDSGDATGSILREILEENNNNIERKVITEIRKVKELWSTEFGNDNFPNGKTASSANKKHIFFLQWKIFGCFWRLSVSTKK